MTREELHYLKENTCNDDQIVEILFDKINDIESRICGNCKHFNYHMALCDNNSYLHNAGTVLTEEDMCNKFERKTDGDV